MPHPPLTRRQEYRVAGLNEPVSHYTDAVRWGDLLFVSGVAPLDAAGALVGTDAATQAEQVFQNLAAILAAAGAQLADTLKVTVFVADVADRQAINAVRQRWFGAARPASTLIGGVDFVVPGMRVEIESVIGLRG